MTTKNADVWAKKLTVLGVWVIAFSLLAIVGLAIFINVNLGTYLLEVAVAVIALSAMAVSIWSAWLMRKHFRLSVEPWLEFAWKDDDNLPQSGCLSLVNNGLGPAIVTEIRIAINDTPCVILTEEAALEIYRNLNCPPGPITIPSQDGTSLRAGEKIDLLSRLPYRHMASPLRTIRATASFKSMYRKPKDDISTEFESPVAAAQQPETN